MTIIEILSKISSLLNKHEFHSFEKLLFCSVYQPKPDFGDVPVRPVFEFIVQTLIFVRAKRFYLKWFLYEVPRLNASNRASCNGW